MTPIFNILREEAGPAIRGLGRTLEGRLPGGQKVIKRPASTRPQPPKIRTQKPSPRRPLFIPAVEAGKGSAAKKAAAGVGVLAASSFLTLKEKKEEKPAPKKVGLAEIVEWEEKKQEDRSLFILAGLNGLGRDLTIKALEKKTDVLAFSREPLLDPNEQLCIANTPKDPSDTDAWIELLEPTFKTSTHEEIAFVNMIGGDKGKPEINESALAMASAMSQLCEKYGRSAKFIQISSFVPEFLGHTTAYSEIRDRVDHAVLEEYPHLTTTVLRLDIVIPKDLDKDHPFAAQQFSKMPGFQLAVDTKGFQTQPTFNCDLVDAILNLDAQTKSQIVIAVGEERLSQSETVEFFTRLQGKTPNVVNFPIGNLLAWVAKNAPRGRLDDFAITLVQDQITKGSKGIVFDTKPFEELVGHPLTRMDSLKPEDVASTTLPPFMEVIKDIYNVIKDDPVKRKEFFQVLREDLPRIAENIIKALLK